MEKIINYLKRNIKLAFKTVTYHFKPYLCFYIAVYIIETLFGIIAMSSSNSAYLDKKNTETNYNYHICLVGMNQAQYEYLEKLQTLDYDPNDYKGQIVPPPAVGVSKALEYVTEESRKKGKNTVYDVYYMFDDGEGTSKEKLFKRFKNLYEKDLKKLGNKHFNYELSPLYTLDERISSVKGECALWLILLAVVSVIILILLYNIRINHFKFTYGIYMSFGADTKRLFGTCFWEILMIALLTFIPATITSTVADFLFYKTAHYDYRFAPYLMLFCLIFIIPVVALAVFVPVKATAVKPPLKLLLAEDNSNLVSSPRMSTQMLGKKFPSGYEAVTISRFRKYNLQLTVSSVIFAAIFVWTSFYCGIYSYAHDSEKPEFVVDFKQHKKVETENQVTKGKENTSLAIYRKKLYTAEAHFGMNQKDSEVSQFEKYLDREKYKIVDGAGGQRTVTEIKTGKDCTVDYYAKRNAVCKSDHSDADMKKLEECFDLSKYVTEKNDYDFVTNVYEKVIVKVEHVIYEGDTYTNEKGEELMSMPGVKEVYKSCMTDGVAASSFMVFQRKDTRNDCGFLVHPKANETGFPEADATINVNYCAADDEIVRYIMDHFEYSGYPEELLDPEFADVKQVIISDSVNNKSVMKITAGDRIKIAKVKSYTPPKDEALAGNMLLESIIQKGEVEYEEYIVAAVIKNMSSDGNMSVFIPETDYRNITGKEPLYKQVSVYVDQEMAKEAINSLNYDIRDWASKYSYTNVNWTNSLEKASTERSMRKLPLFHTIAIMVLVISPLFWFFAQIMFYKKREKEFELLRGMGALEKEIKKLFIYDGLLFAGIGMLFTALFSGAGVFLMYKFTQKLLTLSAQTSNVRYVFEIPWIPVIIAVVSTALFGFMSCFIPYGINKKVMEKKNSVEFSEE